MPKRDEAYMEQQRRLIAEATLELFLEKGIYETSLRDICDRAGVSPGAFYIHFANKADAIDAACLVHFEHAGEAPAVESWDRYLSIYTAPFRQPDMGRNKRRTRLAFQFVAELAVLDKTPRELATIHRSIREQWRATLLGLKRRGEIDLPSGVDLTVDMHMQLVAGLAYQIASDPEIDRARCIKAVETALAATAGAKPPGH
jgi:AcrR family transcriptional regulator